MEHLPINLNLKGRKAVVAGGDTHAAQRAELALKAGAEVLVVAPELSSAFAAIERMPQFSHRPGIVAEADLAGAFIAFGGSGDAAEDRRLSGLAHAAGALVAISDRPELSDFIMPAVIDRSPLVIAVSSGGTSPLLTRLITERLQGSIPAACGGLASFLRDIRERVDARIPDPREQRRFLEKIVDGKAADLVLAGDRAAAEARVDAELDAHLSATGVRPVGEVFLVGGGPGDPDLLTFRALRLIQRADVVVYDRLIGSPILDLVRRDAERIYVGKRKNLHEMPQEEISLLLVKLAREGRRVLRLKGGDPFIFGRGGEELETLAEAGIPFQVVPGVTAASGCASYAGIPLTHRDHAQVCIFVTGHAKHGKPDVDWPLLLRPNQTVAIYMGLAALPELTAEFIARGADPLLPVAIVENGTRPTQRVVTGTVADIAAKARDAALKGPAIIIVGTVVSLHEKLDWFHPGTGSDAGRTLPAEIAATAKT
jgi:uroporphyrin-III C-methyltransferase/precorrin-2 dehydrogenase/sirohydrochlorin ferrochelatase